MNKKQTQQLDQFQSTDILLTGSDNIWNLPGYAKFVINVTAFRNLISEVIRNKDLQITDVHGARRHAVLARIEMADRSEKVRGAVQNYASDTDDTLLFQQVRFSRGKLLYSGIQKSLSYARIIESKARAIIDDLSDYNLTLAELDLYKSSITTFENAHLQVGQIKIDRKNATDQLKVLCPATRNLVQTKLRTGATQFIETAPEFYKRLLLSFKINNYPTHYTEFDIVTRDKATHETLEAVKITATSDKGTMLQFSNPVGEAIFKQFEGAYWTITYECPGYELLTMQNIKMERGEKMELVADLVKLPEL
jgi:hypothetical protein